MRLKRGAKQAGARYDQSLMRLRAAEKGEHGVATGYMAAKASNASCPSNFELELRFLQFLGRLGTAAALPH